jgi:hypothetical protein
VKILALFLALTSPALAITSICELPEPLDGYVNIHLDREEGRFDRVSSELVLGGEEVPALASSCFYLDVPGSRGFRCTHVYGETRVEVYPRFSLLNDPVDTGRVKRLHLIFWEGSSPRRVDIDSCR